MSIETKNKKTVDLAKKTLLNLGYDVKTTHLYEMFAKLGGCNSWAVAKRKNLDFSTIVCHFEDKQPSSLLDLTAFDNYLINPKIFNHLYVGITEKDGKEFIIDFEKKPNCLYVGSMGSGKTLSLLNSLAVYMATNSERASLFIVDILKDAFEFSPFFQKDNAGKNKYSQVSNLINSKEKLELLLISLEDECLKRKKLFLSYKSKNVSDYEKITKQKLNRCVVVMEELHHILLDIDFTNNIKDKNSIAYKLCKILRDGQNCGIYVIGITQNGMIDSQVISSFSNKFVFKTSSSESKFLLGNDYSSKILDIEKGRFFNEKDSVQSLSIFNNDPKILQIILEKYMKINTGLLLSESLKSSLF